MSQDYNASNSFLYANGVKIYQFKERDSEIKQYLLRLELFQKILQLITWKKTGLNEYAYDFIVNYETIGFSDMVDNHKYLTKKYDMV